MMFWATRHLVLTTTAALLLGRWEWSSFPSAEALFVVDNRTERQINLVHRRRNFENVCSERTLPSAIRTTIPQAKSKLYALPPRVWVKEAEEGFVDEEENLEPGEVCLRSVKSFASAVPRNSDSTIRIDFEIDDVENRRFLSAGALVRRPFYDNDDSNEICDAWMADSLLNEGGPNLQLMGALLVLDDLFLDHLQRELENHRAKNQMENENPSTDQADDDSWAIRALENFVVHCGDEDEDDCDERLWRSTSHVAASEMAASLRGFVPLGELVRKDSIYTTGHYDGDTSGLVLDPLLALDRYSANETEHSTKAESIAALLPSEETVARHTTKRFTIIDRGNKAK